jgi:hypothetical protein
MATAHFLAGRYEDGFSWAKIAVQQNPDYVGGHRILMSCHAMAGRVEEARRAWAATGAPRCSIALTTSITSRLVIS